MGNSRGVENIPGEDQWAKAWLLKRACGYWASKCLASRAHSMSRKRGKDSGGGGRGWDTGCHVLIGSCFSIKTQFGCYLHWEVSPRTSRYLYSLLAQTTLWPLSAVYHGEEERLGWPKIHSVCRKGGVVDIVKIIIINNSKQKLLRKLNRTEWPEGGALTLWDKNWAQQEETKTPFLANSMKIHGLFVYCSPLNVLLLSIKMFFPYRMGTCMELAMVADFKLQFFAGLE